MRASRADWLVAAAVAGSLLLGYQAAAQGLGQPRQLFPQDRPHSRSLPSGDASGAGGASSIEEPSGVQARDLVVPGDTRRRGERAVRSWASGSNITIDQLDHGVPETIGTLEPAEGGLGLDLWRNSKRDEVIRLVRVIPDDIESPALRRLAKRLLLSSATSPTRGEGPAASGELLRARAERLYALGAHDELLKLLRALPREASEDPLLVRLHLESALLSHERSEACRLASAAIDRFEDAAYWQEALIYCQIREGEEAAAGLGLSLLSESGDGDQQLAQLAEAALGHSDAPLLQDASALKLAYLDALDGAPTSGLVEQAPYAFLEALSQHLSLGAEERLPLAERAVQFGLLEPRRLAEAYERQRFDPEALADPRSAAGDLEGPRARALLYKAAWHADSASEKLALLETLLELSALDDLTLAALQVAGDLLLDVQPDADLAARAPLAVKSLLVAGRLEQATAWMRMLAAAAARDEEAEAAYAAVWPLAYVAGIEAEDVLDLNSWSRSRSAAAGAAQAEEERAFLQLISAALSGRRNGTGEGSFSRVGGAAPPSPSLLYALERAAADGRRGETILLTLQLLGGGSLGDHHPQALAESVTALAHVGLETDARAIAVESLLVKSN